MHHASTRNKAMCGRSFETAGWRFCFTKERRVACVLYRKMKGWEVSNLYRDYFTGPKKDCLKELERIKKGFAHAFAKGQNSTTCYCNDSWDFISFEDNLIRCSDVKCALKILQKEPGISVQQNGKEDWTITYNKN